MQRSPRRQPPKFRRTASRPMRNVAQKRRRARRWYWLERMRRSMMRLRKRIADMRTLVFRLALIAIAGIVVLSIVTLLFSSYLHIREIRIRRTDPRIDIARVQTLLAPLFNEHLFFLEQREVRLLLDGYNLDEGEEASRGERVVDLQSIGIAKSYPDTLVVELTLQPLVARAEVVAPAEEETIPQVASGSLLLITDEGMLVEYPARSTNSGAQLPLIRLTDWGVRPRAWITQLDPKMLSEMQHAEQLLDEQFGQTIEERIVYLRAQEYHLRLPEYTLWFDTRNTLESQLQRYRVFLRTVGPSVAEQYIDLRIADRVIYR